MTSHIPPQDLQAEKVVLGAMLIDPTVIPEVASVIDRKDFYFESHQKIYAAMLTLVDRREPVDLITVGAALDGQVLTADIVGMTENALPSHAKRHAELVKEKSQKRKILEAIRQTEEDIDSGEDCLAIAGRLSSAISHLLEGGSKGFVHVGDVVDKTIKQIEQAYERQDLVTGIPTGLADFDNRVGGIHRGALTVFAGRPSMGKTAVAVTIAKNAAEKGYGVAFVSAESPAPRIVQRILAGASGIENRDLMSGKLTDEEFIELTRQATRVTNLPLWLLDSDRSWDRIKAKLRALKLKEPNLALVILDYVGLLSAQLHGERRLERYLEIGRISSEAKGLAIDLDLGVLLLSQLNREVEGRTDKKPKLSDLRESGCLEQDGDLIGLLYREIYYNEKAKYKELAELEIAKNRDGCTGVIKLPC